jgi:AGCS family alanine or glycine:cation symporter
LVGILSAVVLFGKISKISDITVRLVPFMSFLYIVLSLIIIFLNVERLPSVFSLIFKSAFTPDSAAGGIAGYGISRAVRFGATRGIFSNEAGCGSSTIAHASSDEKSPARQGLFGIAEVFFDTIVLCTLTALVTLLAFDGVVPQSGGGTILTFEAFERTFGGIAGYVLSFAVFLFAFATIICWAYYGVECIKYFSRKRVYTYIYLAVYVLITAIGSLAASDLVWSLADFSVSAMLLINIFAVLFGADRVKELSEQSIISTKK